MKSILRLRFLILLLLYGPMVFAQWQNGLWTEKQANNWYFGFNAGINFNTNPPTAITDSAIEGYASFPDPFLEGTGSISDAEGNTLFYTNGKTVWNANNEVMLNGEGLQTVESTFQTGLIVPAPGDPGIYYIFTSGGANTGVTSGPMVYSEVDMSLDGGLGGVTANKNIQIATDVEERMTAVHHADGQRVWVVFQNYNTDEIVSYLVSSEGVSTTPVISHMGQVTLYSNSGAMKISPDGSKLAMSRLIYETPYMEIFNFDNATGQVTELVATIDYTVIPDPVAGIMGLEFSPNSRFLYIGGPYSGNVSQFDLEAGSEQDIRDSKVVVGQSLTDGYWCIQLAPDGKIYLASFYERFAPFLSVINFPNNKGVASGFTEQSFDLAGNENQSSLPGFIQSYFASGILYQGGECPGQDIAFSTLRIAGIESVVWDFGDPDSGGDNVSTDIEPVHAFSNGGTYTVTAVITSNGALQTATTQVTVLQAPEVAIPSVSAITQCADGSGKATFNLNDLDAEILAGQNATDYTVSYYISAENIGSGDPVSTPDAFITDGQAIYALITNTATGCTTTIQFDLVVSPLPVVGTPGTFEQCDNSSGTAVFDLTAQTALILNGQSPAEFNVVYYTDAAGTNEIAQPESFGSSGQIVYAYVYSNATGCSASTEFELVLLPLPSLPPITTFTGCSPFDLVAIAGEPAGMSSYSFFTNEDDAINNINVVPNASRYIIEGNTGIIYIRVESNDGCIQIAELSLDAGDCLIPRGISPNNDSMNDVFDLSGFDIKYMKIFNRYGQEVYNKRNYINEWSGQSDNGDELPSGTYYYMIALGDGESKTGWVYINRQE